MTDKIRKKMVDAPRLSPVNDMITAITNGENHVPLMDKPDDVLTSLMVECAARQVDTDKTMDLLAELFIRADLFREALLAERDFSNVVLAAHFLSAAQPVDHWDGYLAMVSTVRTNMEGCMDRYPESTRLSMARISTLCDEFSDWYAQQDKSMLAIVSRVTPPGIVASNIQSLVPTNNDIIFFKAIHTMERELSLVLNADYA